MRTTIFFIFLYTTLVGQVQPILWQVESDTMKQWNYFFGDDIHSHSDDDEMKFSDFAKKVQALSMLPRMRGEI